MVLKRSGKVIDSDSSCYQNKVTRCLVHEDLKVQKLIPLSSLQSNLPKCPDEASPPPPPILLPPPPLPCPPPNVPSPISQPVLASDRPDRDEDETLAPPLPQLPRDILAVGWVCCADLVSEWPTQKDTVCGHWVCWPHVSVFLSMRQPGGGERGSGEGWLWGQAGPEAAAAWVTMNNWVVSLKLF